MKEIKNIANRVEHNMHESTNHKQFILQQAWKEETDMKIDNKHGITKGKTCNIKNGCFSIIIKSSYGQAYLDQTMIVLKKQQSI